MQVEQMTGLETTYAIDNTGHDRFFSPTSNLEVKITNDEKELKSARKLRLRDHSDITEKKPAQKKFHNNTLHSKQLIEEQRALIHDGYDSFANHLIIIDHDVDQVIAYVRLIDAFTAYKIGGYYCETQFNLSKLFNSQTFYLEMSRLVIDPNYYSREIAALLWSGITRHAEDKCIDSIIGCLSLSLTQDSDVYSFLKQLKKQAMSHSRHRVQPYQLLPDNGQSGIFQECREKPLIDYFFEQGVKLCGDAYWNKEYKSAELFVHYPVTNATVVPECIRINDIQLGQLCK